MWTRLRRDMRTSLHFTSMSIADKIFSREKRAKVREEGRAKMGALCAVPLVVGDGVDERVRFVKCRTLLRTQDDMAMGIGLLGGCVDSVVKSTVGCV